jgi:hypothetical protein
MPIQRMIAKKIYIPDRQSAKTLIQPILVDKKYLYSNRTVTIKLTFTPDIMYFK